MESEDINGKTYKFVGMFDPQTIVKRVKYLYQKEYDRHQKQFNRVLKKEIAGMKKEGLLDTKPSDD
jgi:hypothetical protein